MPFAPRLLGGRAPVVNREQENRRVGGGWREGKYDFRIPPETGDPLAAPAKWLCRCS